MLSILGNRKIIVSILTMVFLIVGVQGMSYGQPDLTVALTGTSPLNPATVDPGGEFTISVTVINRNREAASPATTLVFYRSTDMRITTTDTPVGVILVQPIAAGGSLNLSGSLSAPDTQPTASNPQLTYNYGAYVLPVAGEEALGNNASATTRLTVRVTAKPDLQVTHLGYYYNPNNPTGTGLYTTVVPGGNFILQVTVENQGDAPFPAGTLAFQYYSSTSWLTSSSVPTSAWLSTGFTTTITTPIPARNSPGNSRTVSINLPAPSTFGTFSTYYYHVRVTPADGVSNSDNNPPNSNPRIIITSSGDLVVGTPTVDKSTLAPGETFTLTSIVRNQGFGNSTAATLRYYLSTDTTISTDTTTTGTADTEVGTADTIGILSGSNTVNQVYPNTSTQTVELTAPTTPGTYHYGACVTTNFYETRTDNNCSGAITITVSAPPDLVAELFDFRPATVAPGARLTLDATVTNDGEGQSPTTTLRFYESIDRRFRSEEEIGRVSVGALASNRSSTESIRLTAPSEPGTYYYRAYIDEVANETATANNWSDYIVLFVEAPLVIESVQASKSTLAPRERFTLTATIKNDGSTTSARTAVAFYSSADDSITSRDTSIGTGFVSAIAARATGQASLTLNAPTGAGTYYYGVCVGDDVGSDVCEVVEISVVDISIANFQRPPMYWVQADEGTLHSLTGSEIDPFASGVQNANSIAVDMAGGKVYWTEQTGENTGRIRRADLSGSNVETIRELNNVPYGIAVDASNEKLYVTNSRGKVQRFNLDGSNFESDFIINLDSPRGIAVDAAGGKIYWTEQTGEDTGRLQRADLDGSNVETIRALNNVPYGIAVDASNEKLYVTNSRGKVQRFNLDGSNFEWNFIVNLDSPRGIALDVAAGKVYWTEANSIRRANLNGSNRQDVVTGIGTPASIALRVAPVSTQAAAAPGAAAVAPDATALHANYPNPFNPETWIPYQLQHGADVQISIHSQSGVLVRELSLGYQAAGQYMSRSRAAYWDGRNQLGEPVASGLYFYTLTAGDFSATRRMLILK